MAVQHAQMGQSLHRSPVRDNPRRGVSIPNRVLWTAQVLLAVLFLFAGGMKVVLPLATLTQQMPLPGLFMKFIGVCEFLGALGLVLPGLLRIRTELTPLAASGLVIIMIGATVCTIVWLGVLPAVMPLVVGMLAAFVAYGRSYSTPLNPSSVPPVLRRSSVHR